MKDYLFQTRKFKVAKTVVSLIMILTFSGSISLSHASDDFIKNAKPKFSKNQKTPLETLSEHKSAIDSMEDAPIFEHEEYMVNVEQTTSKEIVVTAVDNNIATMYLVPGPGSIPDFVSFEYTPGESSLILTISPDLNHPISGYMFQVCAQNDLAQTSFADVHIFVNQYDALSAKILPHAPINSLREFGSETAIAGNYAAVVGLESEEKVYIFKRTGNEWSQVQEILGEVEPHPGSQTIIDMSNDWLFIGSTSYNPGGLPYTACQGIVYVYKRNGNVFEKTQDLIASNGKPWDCFGIAVNLSNTTAAIGSIGNPNDIEFSGSVYVYELENDTWVEKNILSSTQQHEADNFGMTSISIDTNRIIVGARCDDENGEKSGAAYIFEKNGESWEEKPKLFANDADSSDGFGNAVAISGDYAFIGASEDEDNAIQIGHVGSVYIFKRSLEGSWNQQAKIQASNFLDCSYFGTSIDLNSTTAIIGARGGRNYSNEVTGTAYVYELNGSTWQEVDMLVSNDGMTGDFFGSSVGLSSDSIIIGAKLKDLSGYPLVGAAYIFKLLNEGQRISLKPGWNVVSFNVLPENMDMESIFEPLINQGILEIIQDDGTGTLWPAYNINTIGQMSTNEGYKVKMTANAALTVTGPAAPLPAVLTLDQGWNTIGYPSGEEQSALSILQPLIDSEVLMQAIDENNNTVSFIGGTWVNQIGNFKPGEGYHVKVSSACSLIIQ
ncbi:MAG: FG-GAP repeat protein [Candidatus Aceula meridiana]|nr:FG-GAP repeat protein [Candidatus Aceula meridiana]